MGTEQESPEHRDDRYFTLQGYKSIIERALELKYQLVMFREFPGPNHAPVLILRHDLDHCLHGVEQIVELEADLGVRATYFVQVACDHYNLLSRPGRELLA